MLPKNAIEVNIKTPRDMAKFSVISLDNTKLMCYNSHTKIKKGSDLNG
jgi:hypothetical protein